MVESSPRLHGELFFGNLPEASGKCGEVNESKGCARGIKQARHACAGSELPKVSYDHYRPWTG